VGSDWNDHQSRDAALYWRVTRVPVLVLLGWFTLSHLFLGSVWVFIDGVNLLFHEAGHLLFAWGWDSLVALGGTLGQLMWPAACAAYFWYKRKERFAAVVCLWWLAENFVNIARYVGDAAFEELPLVGGDTHDWNHLLGKWGMLHAGQEIGRTLRFIGALGMIAALAVLVWWTVRPRDDERDSVWRA
jgi:hypothetical protein